MSDPKKKEKSSLEDEQADSMTEMMNEFANAVSQNILEKDMSSAETFESYAHQLRTHLHSKPEVFRTRFSEGYRVLLDEIEKPSK